MQERRKAYLKEVGEIDARDLVFVDESGVNTAMTRTRARAPAGERAVGKVPRNRGTVTTVLGALTLAGVTALMTIEGGTSGAVFSAFAEQVLAPKLKPGQVVVLDNLAAHKAADARRAIEKAGARLLFLPQYHPELNPIEEAWGKVKAHVRTLEPRSIMDLDGAVVEGAEAITAEDAAGWYQHAGYQLEG